MEILHGYSLRKRFDAFHKRFLMGLTNRNILIPYQHPGFFYLVDCSLEQTLYLKDYGYDMIHGEVNIPQDGPEISVSGPEKKKFWTEQTLKRNGFWVVEKGNQTITIADGVWQLNLDQQYNSIGELLKSLS